MKITINSLSVNLSGNRENKAIVFVHGFPYDHSMWDAQVKALEKDYFCVAYDIRGLGESYVGDGQYTMEAYVDDLFSVVSELKLDKPVLCGLSMGGYIALRAMERNQSLFGGLILCDSRSEADNNEGKLKRAATINQINTQGLDSFVEPFVKFCFAEETPAEQPHVFNTTLKNALRNSALGVKGATIALLSRTDTTPVLSEINIPTLVIVGSFDRLTPPTVMRDIAEKIKDSEFAIVPRAGHMSPIENPAAVNDLIIGFLKRRIK